MKKALLLFALAALMTVGHAQNPLTYDFVVQKEGATAGQIYTALVDWIATSFKSVDSDFFRDKEEKMITKDVMYKFSTGKLRVICYDGSISYKLKFQCRDGRFRVQMTNFEHKNNPGNNASCVLGLIMDQPVRGANGKFDEEVWQMVKQTTDAEAARMQGIFEALNITTTNDDW